MNDPKQAHHGGRDGTRAQRQSEVPDQPDCEEETERGNKISREFHGKTQFGNTRDEDRIPRSKVGKRNRHSAGGRLLIEVSDFHTQTLSLRQMGGRIQVLVAVVANSRPALPPKQEAKGQRPQEKKCRNPLRWLYSGRLQVSGPFVRQPTALRSRVSGPCCK